ncbi:hypothetical protein Hanom_Chr09g00762371 [Helianthus anomalus]
MDNNFNIPCSGGNNSDNENELNSELASKLKRPRKKKQLPNRNFMSPTISAANKASVPKKKSLGERNETLDAVEQHFGSKPMTCSVVDSDDDAERDFVGSKPYDPVKNYVSPRTKFLRYSPDRRRKILSLQENVKDRVEVSTDFDAGSIGIPELQDSCSGQESSEPVERLKEGDVYDDGRQDVSATSENFVEEEVVNDDSYVIQEENKTSEVVETEYVDAGIVDDSNQK